MRTAKLYNDIMTCELLSRFFTSISSYEQLMALAMETSKINSLCGFENSSDLRAALNEKDYVVEYNGLFYGTNYKVKVPLWASACKSQVPILLNETTLEVIQFYHKWGYTWEAIDGNPADFIGTQLKFIAYLKACSLHAGEEQGKVYSQAVEDFIQLALVDTVARLTEAVEKNTENKGILQVMQVLKTFVFNDCESEISYDEAFVKDFVNTSSLQEVIEKGRHKAIKDEAAHIVRTGGFNNCGGRCVIVGKVQEDCVLDITTDTSENDSQIRACVRGRGYRYTYFNTDRLRYPMKRVGERGEGKFVRISWEEAIDEIYKNWVRITKNYGPQSRFVMYSWGVSAMMRPDNMAKRLLSLDGGYLDAYNTYSDACTVYISPYIYGDSACGNGVEDVLNTKFLILWGHNPAETIFGTQKNYYITKLREKGVEIVVIDPRQSESALTYGDEWIGIVPSTDSALADGMAYVIWTENLMDKTFMDKYCLGFDKDHMPEGADPTDCYESYLFGEKDGVAKTPEWAEKLTGVPADKIRELARKYATAKPACIMPGLGLQRTGNGEQTTRSLAMLAAMTGNVGIPGGGSAGSIWEQSGAVLGFPIPENKVKAQIPNFLWSKTVDRGQTMDKNDGLVGVDKLDTGIKMIFNLAGNVLINQHGNINETAKILKDESKCEFIVCSDVFMTASTRYADILLPAASGFEVNNMTMPWLNGDYIIYNNRMRAPFFDCKFELDWITALAERLGYKEAFTEGHATNEEWIEDLYNQTRAQNSRLPEYDVIKQNGIFRWKKEKPFVAYEENIADFENHPFNTPSGKIEIYSQRLKDLGNDAEIPAIPKYVECSEGPNDPVREKFPLQLIGWHTKRRCHSIHDNNVMMEEISPQQVWIHVEDAKARGIVEGEKVEVYNDRGRVHISAHLTDRIVRGVCAISQGAWYTPDENGVDIRGCINTLTSTKPTPVAKGNAQHTNLVEIIKIAD